MIIEIDFKRPVSGRVFGRIDNPSKSYSCRHTKMLFDDHLRELSCEGCGKVIDAYDYISGIAGKESRLHNSVIQLEQTERDFTTKINELKRELKNLKARIGTELQRPAITKVDATKSILNIRALLK